MSDFEKAQLEVNEGFNERFEYLENAIATLMEK